MGKARIVVVEDEAVIAKDIQMRLERLGYEVPCLAATGEDAIAKLAQHQADLILMDIMLIGNMDGIEVANQARLLYDIPVIYLTSYADEEILERAKITDPFGYMIKPVSDKELHSNIELTLNKYRIEKKLKENEKWLSTVLSSIGDAVITTDIHCRVEFMNPTAESLTGWNNEEAMGRPIETIFNILDEKTGDKIENPADVVLRDKIITSISNDAVLVTKDGKKIPVSNSSAPVIDEKNILTGVVLVFSDISDRKRSEEALRKSEEQIRMLLNSTAEAIYGMDTDGNCTFCNPSSLKILGYEKEDDLLGKNMHTLIHHTKKDGTAYPESECKIHEVMKHGKGIHVDDEVIWRADGSSFYAEYRCYPTKSGDTITGTVVSFLDITKRRQAEKFIKNILESVGEGFIVIDEDYRILSANKTFCTQVKQPVEHIIGKNCYQVSHHSSMPCYKMGEDCPVKKTFDTGTPGHSIHTHYDKDGTPVYKEIKSYAMKDEMGNVVSVIETVNDLTEQKKLEAQLRHSQKMEAVGHLAGGVAHDFNNILTAIVGYANILKMKMKEDDPMAHNVHQILASSERAANLTRSLLSFSRKEIMNPQPVSFNTIVERVYKLLKRLIGEDIQLITRLTDKDTTIMADSGQIEQVLMNLATNARDAMPDGGSLTITTDLIELDDKFVASHGYGIPGRYTEITISDTGLGMDAHTRHQIFEPFFTTKEVGKGTGLGLAMTYGIIKQHNGYINVYSEPGEGTTFRIYLPIVEAKIRESARVKTESILGGSETLLLAEDDAAARSLIQNVLEEFGYTVIVSVDGEDAIEKYIENQERIQLLVLDVIMPKKSGKETFDKISKMRPDIKTLFISGYTADIIHNKGILGENLNFISKPFSPQEVLKKIREILDSR